MKHYIRLIIISLLSLWATNAGAQSQHKSVIRAGIVSSDFSLAQVGLSLEYAYRFSSYFSSAIMVNEETAWKRDFTRRYTSIVCRGYYRPWAKKDFGRRWETGLGLGYENIFRANETPAPNLTDMEYNPQNHHVMRIEIPIRFYILDTGRLELAAELGGVVGLKKNWHYYSYCAGLRFGVAF